jgi:putative ABC transport system permease protein
VTVLVARAGRRFFRRHPWHLALALVGVALGVAVVTGVDLAGNAARKSFDASLSAVVGKASHQLLPTAGSFDESLYPRLRRELGLKLISPVVEGQVDLSLDETPRLVTLVGLDPFAERPFRDYVDFSGDGGVDVGALMSRPGTVVLSRELGEQLGVDVGDTLRVRAKGRPVGLTVLDRIAVDAGSRAIVDDYLFADIATAQEVLRSAGELTRVDLILTPGEEARLAAWLPPGIELVATAARSEAMAEMTRAFRVNLLALSLLALVVGAFLIYSTMSFLVVRRHATIATLRTLGVSRRQLFGAVMQEALLVGVPGTLLGLLIGTALGGALTRLVARTIDDLYFRVHGDALVVDPLVLLKAAALGILVTLAATLGPAAEAAGIPPRTVLSRASLERRARQRLPWLVAGAGIAFVVAWLLLGIDSRSLVPAFGGLFAVIVAGALLTPPTLAVAMAGLMAAVGRRLGMPERMAVRGVTASLSRTGVASAALTVAVAALIGVGVMVGSFRGSVQDWLASSLQADAYVRIDDAFYATAGGDAEALADRFLALPEVDGVSRSVRERLATGGEDLRVWGVDYGDGPWGMVIVDGDRPDLREAFRAGTGVLATEPWSRRKGLGPGDRVEVPTPDGPVTLPILGVFRDYASDRGGVAMHLSLFRRLLDEQRLDGIGLLAAAEVTPEQLRDAATTVVAAQTGLVLALNAEVRSVSMDIFDRTFTITRVLQALVGVVAFLGILGALQALQMERAREFAVLRAVGWTPAQVRRLVLGQTGLLGLAAGLLAIPLGLALAWLLIRVINLRAFGWTIQFDPGLATLLQGVLLALVAALVGGAHPAWRAGARSPAADLREE